MSSQNTKSEIDPKFEVGDIIKPKIYSSPHHTITKIEHGHYYLDGTCCFWEVRNQDQYELVATRSNLVAEPNEIRYQSPSGTLYRLCDVSVRPFNVIHRRVDMHGIEQTTLHTSYEIFHVPTGDSLDTFNGEGFGSLEDAQDSIERNKVCILGDVVEKVDSATDDSDGFDYQDIETILDGIDENDFETTNRNLNLTRLEYHRLNRFKYNHCDCGHDVDNGMIGLGISLEFTYNAIGRSVVAKCPHCKKTANITDYSVW